MDCVYASTPPPHSAATFPNTEDSRRVAAECAKAPIPAPYVAALSRTTALAIAGAHPVPTNTPPAKKLTQSATSRPSTVNDAPPSTFTPPPLPFSSGSEHPMAEKLRSDATVSAPAT